MKKLLVTYADGSKETVPSELAPADYFDSRFGGLPEDIQEKCKVVAAPKDATAPKEK